jgi:disulfide oxidoreductase YuzD
MKLLRLFESVDYYSKYPVLNKEYLNGLKVTENIPNTESIDSSLYEYEVLDGIRIVPLSDFNANPKDLFYAKNDIDRTKSLANKIKENKYIDPLIVVIDKEGPYILEGGHRLGALFLLNKKYFPALVVLDLN